MIVAGYLAVALVVGVTAALLAVVAARAPGRVRLFLRSLRWGVSTGAATGAVIGAMVLLAGGIGSDDSWLLSLIPAGLLYGAVVGVVVSLLPSLIGAAVITGLIGPRLAHPSAEEAVQSDLRLIFGVVVGLLDTVVLIALVASVTDLSSVAVAVPFIVAGNAGVVLMLCRARISISRLSR